MMKKRSLRVAAASALTMAITSLAVAGPAEADRIGYEGCTPGYWKNHPESWLEKSGKQIRTTKTFERAYRVRDLGPWDGTGTPLDDLSMLEVLSLGGGPGTAGAQQILGRAATAAYLNAATEELGYPWRRHREGKDGRPALVSTVRAALDSGDRERMLDLASRLDADNNLGCPL